MSDDCTIRVANDFTDTPGGRYITDGDFSGEEFRIKYLEPRLEKCDKITVVMDGAYGYATSFLEEAFGGLARIHGEQAVLSKLDIVSNEDPILLDRIKLYIKQAGSAK